MANGHGGKRDGAGRPRKQRPATAKAYATAAEYLAAVIDGTEQPDALRIAAAKALLPFEAPVSRSKPSQAAPKQLRARENLQAEEAARAAWRERSAAVCSRHAEKV
jgi:hypothetical protein